MKNQKLKKILDRRMKDFEASKKLCKPWGTKPVRITLKTPWFNLPLIHLYRNRAYFRTVDIEKMFDGNPWDNKRKKLCWFQYWVRDTLPFEFGMIGTRLSRRWYEFRCWLKPFNVLKIKTLPNTWSDEDTLLVHSMFAVLQRFFDENPAEVVDYSDEPWKTFWREINEVWDWWNRRDEREEKIKQAYKFADGRKGKPYQEKYKELHLLEAQYEEEQTWALQTIIKHRHHLWV